MKLKVTLAIMTYIQVCAPTSLSEKHNNSELGGAVGVVTEIVKSSRAVGIDVEIKTL